jgi:hypothetical protein
VRRVEEVKRRIKSINTENRGKQIKKMETTDEKIILDVNFSQL